MLNFENITADSVPTSQSLALMAHPDFRDGKLDVTLYVEKPYDARRSKKYYREAKVYVTYHTGTNKALVGATKAFYRMCDEWGNANQEGNKVVYFRDVGGHWEGNNTWAMTFIMRVRLNADKPSNIADEGTTLAYGKLMAEAAVELAKKSILEVITNARKEEVARDVNHLAEWVHQGAQERGDKEIGYQERKAALLQELNKLDKAREEAERTHIPDVLAVLTGDTPEARETVEAFGQGTIDVLLRTANRIPEVFNHKDRYAPIRVPVDHSIIDPQEVLDEEAGL